MGFRIPQARSAVLVLIATIAPLTGPVAGAVAGGASLGISEQRDYVSLNAWSPFGSIHVEVYASETGPLLHVADEPLGEFGEAFIRLDEAGIDVAPGTYVTASDGSSSADVIAENLTIDVVDNSGDVVSGVADPARTIDVNIDGTSYEVIADLDGRWSVDVAAIGGDVKEAANVAAFLRPTTPDEGFSETSALQPILYVHPQDASGHLGFMTPGAEVTLQVYDQQGGDLLLHRTLTADATGDAPFHIAEVGMWPGQFIVATDRATRQTKTHMVRWLGIGAVDRNAEHVSGFAWPDRPVTVITDDDGGTGTFFFDLPVDENGRWDADLAAVGRDLTENTSVKAHASDASGDTTVSFEGGDVSPPRTDIHTRHGAIVSRALRRPVTGEVADDQSWVSTVRVIFTPLRGQPVVVEAELACDPLPWRCDWAAAPPIVPGEYHVMAMGADAMGNTAELGPSIDVIAVA